MRVLVTVTGSQGHARTIFPLVRAAVRRGDDVLVATSAKLATIFRPLPVEVVPVLPDLGQILSAMTAMGAGLDPDAQVPLDTRLMLLMFAGGPHVISTYRTLLPIARRFRPDVILRDGSELSACLIAETLGVPHINGPSGPANLIDSQDLADLLNERRAEVGLPVRYDPWEIYRYGRFECMPSGYDFALYDMPPAFAYTQALLDDASPLPQRFAALPDDRPLVLATLGSALPTVVGLGQLAGHSPQETLAAVTAGLTGIDCSAVVATGGFPVPPELVGDNVMLADWVPQTALLGRSALFLTHAGYNGVREAMRLGVPMAMIPQFGDQFHNAERARALGLGVEIGEVTADGVAQACRDALADDRMRAALTGARDAMLRLPSVDDAVSRLSDLHS